MRPAFAVAIACVLALGACQRKAPGPFECQQFVESALGARHDDPRLPRAAVQHFDDLVTQCLTTPYDRELLQCVQETGRAHACFVAFRQRTGRTLPEL